VGRKFVLHGQDIVLCSRKTDNHVHIAKCNILNLGFHYNIIKP